MFTIDLDQWYTISDIAQIIYQRKKIALSPAVIARVKESRAFLEQHISSSKSPIYGINTGFGSLYNVSISPEELSDLQENLIKSHACQVGPAVPQEIVKMMLLLKIIALSKGYSAISIELLELLVRWYNDDFIPFVQQNGSLGASGDLSPLAQLFLPLLHEGKVHYQGQVVAYKEIAAQFDYPQLKLRAKEGLALLNGTQFMLAYAVYLGYHFDKMIDKANLIAAMSIDAFEGRIEPFDSKIGKIRPHSGHIWVASQISSLLKNSQFASQHKKHVQDPYSFRCIPQVVGAIKTALTHFAQVVETEINSVTDNPNVFWEEKEILSAGNFHGEPLAMVLDYLSLAMCELGSIAERRIYLLISGQRDLPTYLVAKSGINSGFMIVQYSAASLVSLNKQYATPSVVDSIVSSNGQEDIVSMGANSALKAMQIYENLKKIIAMEAMTAAQALDFRRPIKSSDIIEDFHKSLRNRVKFIEQDQIMNELIDETEDFLFF
ncbi:MAG: aromatic amino acid ammonia-lyase [Chitinophagales bacterium]|jgi:histidine ammonia-lyase|nr:aromatic amino acid ammonia-lyase [Chitinophagales bacterium]